MIKNAQEKNNGNFNPLWAFMFNDRINKGNLIGIKTANRLLTWSNNQDSPIPTTLDIFFVSRDWKLHFPLHHFPLHLLELFPD
jgi:hypothetical protein